MRAIEIDDYLPDSLEELPEEILNGLKNSLCTRCNGRFGTGDMVMYVVSSNGRVAWWHYRGDYWSHNSYNCNSYPQVSLPTMGE